MPKPKKKVRRILFEGWIMANCKHDQFIEFHKGIREIPEYGLKATLIIEE